jgi:hypothetical protein
VRMAECLLAFIIILQNSLITLRVPPPRHAAGPHARRDGWREGGGEGGAMVV